MQLAKIFKFKGLYQAGRRMDPPLGYFRRFTNAFKTRDGKIRPFGTGGPGTNIPVGLPVSIAWEEPVLSATFKGGTFQLFRGKRTTGPSTGQYVGAGMYNLRGYPENITQVFAPDTLMDLKQTMEYCPAGNFTTAVVNQKLFFCEYVDKSKYESSTQSPTKNVVASNLMKFDGLAISKAGLPTPWSAFRNGSATPPDASTVFAIRAVHFTLGLDGEMVFSNYVEGVWPALALVPTGAYSDAALTIRRPDQITQAGSRFPRYRTDGDNFFDDGGPKYYDKRFISHTGGGITYDASFNIIIPAGSRKSPNLNNEDWLFYLDSTKTDYNDPYDAYYFQIASIVAGVITFKSLAKRFNAITVSWEDVDIALLPADKQTALLSRLNVYSRWANIQTLYYISNTAGYGGPYYLATILPLNWDSDELVGFVPYTIVGSPRPILGTITNQFTDVYDVTRVKVQFPPVIGITNYSNLLVGFDANAIYFNDTSLGGSSEMVSGISNLIPYGSEYGEITAICGSETFLFMSRERKNYVITGELTTGQVNIEECDVAVGGAANARAVSNAFAGKVVFMNNTGVYEVNSAGTITPISSDIIDLFVSNQYSSSTPNDGNLFKNHIFKTKGQIQNGFDGGIFKIALDEKKGFVLFLTGLLNQDSSRTLNQSNVLVYDTNDGSWYEFYSSEATAIESSYGVINLYGKTRTTESERINSGEPAQAQFQTLLLTQRMTMGEASLEKQVNQLKFYGNVDMGGSFRPATLIIGQQNGWEDFPTVPSATNLETYVSYPSEDNRNNFTGKTYTHKQRLDSSKAQAFSISFQTTHGETFYLEGFEIEQETIQTGVKK